MIARCRHRGFTLIETAVASIIGGIVLVGCFSMFLATERMDNAFNDRFERTNDLHIAQMTIRRALLALQMEEIATGRITTENEGISETEPEPRDRLILDADPGAGKDLSGWSPQRFEMVLATPPIALNLAAQSAGWIRMLNKEDSLDFSSPDGSGGAMRSVFELRRTNAREDIMLRAGVIDQARYSSMTGQQPKLDQQTNADELPPEGWTLWWRPILWEEAGYLDAGYQPFADTQGTNEQIATRLAGSIAIARGIERCRWRLYKSDQMIDLYSGASMADLPAYATFEVVLLNGQSSSWMFEIDWVIGDDPNTGDAAEEDADPSGDNDAGEPPRPGGGLDHPTNTNFDLSNQGQRD